MYYLLSMHEKAVIKGDALYFVTLKVAGYIDVFTCQEYCNIVIDKLNYCIERNHLHVYEYVLMPSQLYLITSSKTKHISKALRDLKGYTGKDILKSIAENPEENRKEWLMRLFHTIDNRYQNNAENHFWQFGNQPVSLDNSALLQQKASFVINIPVTAKMVDKPQHYIYSSAFPRQNVKLTEWH